MALNAKPKFEIDVGLIQSTKAPKHQIVGNPLHTHCEPSALYCWILEIICCMPKGRRALLRIPTTGRAKCLSTLGEIKT